MSEMTPHSGDLQNLHHTTYRDRTRDRVRTNLLAPARTAFSDVLFDQVFGQVSQPEPIQGRAPSRLQAVDGGLA